MSVKRPRKPSAIWQKHIVNVQEEWSLAQAPITQLMVATFPGTLKGLRWKFVLENLNPANEPFYRWVIAIARDGNTLSALATSTGGEMYQPATNVLAWGAGKLPAREGARHTFLFQMEEGTSTGQRKMQAGDRLILKGIANGPLPTGVNVEGAIQFFFKT